MPPAARRAAVTGPAPRKDAMPASIDVETLKGSRPPRDGVARAEPAAPPRGFVNWRPSVAPPSALVSEPQLVVTEVEHVAFVDALVVDAHALVVDAVGRTEILDEVGPVPPDHRRVLARNVAVFDRQVGRLGTTPDDELVLVDPV